ncbi:MAG: hypothetical protein EAY75_06940 [Bacteroidetes bacterium]|nr:MAG: hypothetical protein EAY75_06940 [Bacteroidota bacterium]
MARLFILFIFFADYLIAQKNSLPDQRLLSEYVNLQASQMVIYFKTGDYKSYVKYIHPSMINGAGGEKKMIELLNKQNAELKLRSVEIRNIIFNSPTEFVRSKNELQCTISQQTELKPAQGRVITYTTLIAISIDNGKNWKFIDTAKMDIEMVRKLHPNLSSKIVLPPKQKPIVYSM